ncbi:MAG TPA: ATP-binding protein, partial [Puia sp.]|nr:ATP-binding protein [Puia sp.]
LEVVDHILYTAGGNSLYRYDPAANTYTRVWEFPADGHTPDEIWTLKNDGNSALLMGTINGRVLTWDIKTSRLLQEPLADSLGILQYGTIYDLYVGAAGYKWIATAKGGIGVIDPQRSRFHTFSHLPGIAGSPADFVTSFVETPDSNLWIGTEGNGILVYNRRTEHYTRFRTRTAGSKQFPGDKVSNMCLDQGAHIWAAEQSAGIDRIDPATGHTDHYYCNRTAAGLESNWVWMIYATRSNDCWATTLRQVSLMGALYRFDRAANRFTVFDTSLSDVFTLYEDRQGTLWGGNLAQLIAIDRVGRHHRYYPIGFSVRCIYEDKAGRLWLGAEGGGLLLFDRQRNTVIARYTTDEGLCNNTVNSILEDSAGSLWLSTANGLSRFNPATTRFRNYFEADGLQSNEFIYNAAAALRSGEFAFGGIKGFNLFDPLTIRETGNMPGLRLTGITVNGTPIEKDPSLVSKWGADQVEELRVPYDKAFLSFDFTALEFSAPQEIDYAYFMDGWDRKWTDAGHQRKAAYTHLGEGHYLFRVRSSNTEGKWNPAEIRLSITVLPPWYRTAWAYAFYALVIGALLVIYRLYKARQARLKYEIAVAKHNADFFTNISHEFRTPLTLIINPAKDLLKKAAAKDPASDPGAGLEHAELNVIHRNARRMLSLVDQLLLFRKADSGADRLIPTRLNMIDLAREVYLSFAQQARAKDIRYEFNCDRDSIEACADREKVEIILFNLVSNALKYTPPGGAVSLSIAETAGRIEFRVTDSGPGIPAAAGDQIFGRFYQAADTTTRPKPGFGIGLYLARQFAVAHKGELSYTSEVGKGATFTLRLPKGTAQPGDTPPPYTGGQTSQLFQELVTADMPEESPDPAQQAPETLAPLVDEKRSVLIIDDDQAMRNYIGSIFRESMTIYEAADGAEGLRLTLEHLPD